MTNMLYYINTMTHEVTQDTNIVKAWLNEGFKVVIW